MQSIGIIESKLLIPVVSSAVFRERLRFLAEEIPKKKLATVIAGSGYGKTILAAQLVARTGMPTVWYRMDESDGDLPTFIRYLNRGFQKQFGNFSDAEVRFRTEPGFSQLGREAILTAFLGELEKNVDKDVLIVLDDFHLAQTSAEIKDGLDYILRRISPLVHIVLLGRTDPGLPVSKMRLAGELLEISESDLAFDMDEARALFADIFSFEIEEDLLVEIHKNSEGWVSGLVLFYHCMRNSSLENAGVFADGNRERALVRIFEYLEENAFRALPSAIKDFLTRTSVLDKLDAELCDRVLGIENSEEILEYLKSNHLFVCALDGANSPVYQAHHLFQGFLQKKLVRELAKEDLRLLHAKIANVYDSSGQRDLALNHFLQGERFENAALILAEIGMDLLLQGRIRQILSYLDRLPGALVDEDPDLLYLKSKALSLNGDPFAGISICRKALSVFSQRKAVGKAAMCLKEIGLLHYQTGDARKAERMYKNLLKRIDTNSFTAFEMLGILIFFSGLLGKTGQGEKYIEQYLSLMPSFGDYREASTAWLHLNQSAFHFMLGGFEASLRHSLECEKLIQKFGLCSLIPLNCFQLSSCHCCQGRFDKGLEESERGLKAATEFGLFDSQYAWIASVKAQSLLGLGNLADASWEAERSLSIFTELGNRWGRAHSCRILGGIEHAKGNLPKAEHWLRDGLKAIDGLDLRMAEGGLKADLARLCMAQNEYDKAYGFLSAIEHLVEPFRFERFRTLLLFAEYHNHRNQGRKAREYLEKALTAAERDDYAFGLTSLSGRLIPLTNHADASGTDVSELIGGLATPPLRIYCLGEFRVFAGNREIPETRWSSRNALLLFKHLALFGGRGFIHRDFLIELLWPDEDIDKTTKRFHVTMNHLRRMLEPWLSRGKVSSYVRKSGTAYRLHLGFGGFTDVDRFERSCEAAENETDPQNAVTMSVEAEKMYKGDLLPSSEDLYIDWIIQERERIKSRYLRLLNRIMDSMEGRKDFENCVRYAEKYLRADSFAENIYRRLMGFHAFLGNNAEAARIYLKCKKLFFDELGLPLSEETEKLHRKIVQDLSSSA